MRWREEGNYRPWHRWFAWYPVYARRHKKWVWLEFVEREGHYTCNFGDCGWDYAYRFIDT